MMNAAQGLQRLSTITKNSESRSTNRGIPQENYVITSSGIPKVHVFEAIRNYPSIPDGFKSITDISLKSAQNPKRAAALAKARAKIAIRLNVDEKPTLATLRMAAGLTQAELSARISTSQSHYSRIEAGDEIYHSTYEKLREALGVSRDTLAEAIKNTKENNLPGK